MRLFLEEDYYTAPLCSLRPAFDTPLLLFWSLSPMKVSSLSKKQLTNKYFNKLISKMSVKTYHFRFSIYQNIPFVEQTFLILNETLLHMAQLKFSYLSHYLKHLGFNCFANEYFLLYLDFKIVFEYSSHSY